MYLDLHNIYMFVFVLFKFYEIYCCIFRPRQFWMGWFYWINWIGPSGLEHGNIWGGLEVNDNTYLTKHVAVLVKKHDAVLNYDYFN